MNDEESSAYERLHTLTSMAEFDPEERRRAIGNWPLTIDDVRGLQWLITAAGLRLVPADDPAPPRSEYPLQHVTSTPSGASVSNLGVVLVPAHSLRSGDEVEWAPGDWRAIEVTPGKSWVEVTVSEPKGGVDVAHVWEVAAFMLVAVRRSGVTG